jgi:molybdenum-dependent DNA-binding transcriptional regulator ModE
MQLDDDAQMRFLKKLAKVGTIAGAAQQAGVSRDAVNALRRRDEGFAAAVAFNLGEAKRSRAREQGLAGLMTRRGKA